MRAEPYWTDGQVTLYCGRMEDVLPTLGQFDAAICDPPYGETSLSWDRWPDGWPALVAQRTHLTDISEILRPYGDEVDSPVELAGKAAAELAELRERAVVFPEDFEQGGMLTIRWRDGRQTEHRIVKSEPAGDGITENLTLEPAVLPEGHTEQAGDGHG